MRQKDGSEQKKRYAVVDALRGLAVLLMIIFHLMFDLNGFRVVQFELFENPFLYAFPRIIVSLFLVCVGMGLRIAHKDGIQWGRFRRRLYIIGGWALCITIFTFIFFRLPRSIPFYSKCWLWLMRRYYSMSILS